MKWYCEKCRKLHSDDEMCPHIRQQLQKNSDLLVQAANFTTVAGEYELITTNALDAVVSQINKVLGTNLSYEGTTQAARDIRVFKRLNEEAFVKSGVFSSPERARSYLNNATPKQISSMVGKINGSGQEVDWLWYEKSKLSALINRSELLTQNVRDNLDINALDVVNCVPVVNIASWAITGAISVDEKAKLRKFLKTEEGQIMLQHCEIAANLDYKLAKDMLKKIKKCL